jgi:hypothetical protein
MDKRVGRQGGWGLIVILVALAIVAWLYKDALKAYLLLPSESTVTTKAGSPLTRELEAGGLGTDAPDLSSTPVPPRTAIDRARGVEDTVKRGAEQRANQVDSASR